jgi:hypothetical protein
MAYQQPPLQQQQQHPETQKQSETVEQRQTQPVSDFRAATDVEEQASRGKKSGFKLGEAKITAGRAGERNISIECVDVWVGNNKPVRFTVRTAAGNGLEVVMQQASYNKALSGTGTVTTPITPIAPIGTKGKLTIRDTATGEILERPWIWHDLGGGDGMGLWEAIKRLIWKPSS